MGMSETALFVKTHQRRPRGALARPLRTAVYPRRRSPIPFSTAIHGRLPAPPERGLKASGSAMDAAGKGPLFLGQDGLPTPPIGACITNVRRATGLPDLTVKTHKTCPRHFALSHQDLRHSGKFALRARVGSRPTVADPNEHWRDASATRRRGQAASAPLIALRPFLGGVVASP